MYTVKSRSARTSGAALAVIGAAVLLIGAAIAAIVYSHLQPDSGLASDLCPKSGALGHIVLLVDKSDPMQYTQRKDFETRFENLVKQGVPTGHRLSIYAMGDDIEKSAAPIFSRCNPGDGIGADPMTQNPDMLRKRFEQKYLREALAVAPKLITVKEGSASPILEMVQLAVVAGFQKSPTPGPKVLILVSDLVQHVPSTLSMYKQIPQYSEFRTTPYGRRMQVDARGIKFEYWVLLNDSKSISTEGLHKFWVTHALESRGEFKAWNPIAGAGVR